MIKKFLLIFALFTLAAGIVSAQEVNLQEAIKRSARGIEGELPQKAKVAVINFESPSKPFSDYVIDELLGELIEGKKIIVVDRKNIETILGEMKFQYSGYVSDESMQRIGKMLGVQAIISGSLTDIGANYRFRIKIINVETAAIQRQISLDLKKDAQVNYFMGDKKAVQELEKQRRENEKELERQQREVDKEVERQQRKIERTQTTSNVKNNWISFGIGYLASAAIDVNYERMLGPYVSLGINAEGGFYIPSENGGCGIGAFFHWYPWGRSFYLGTGLGYYYFFEERYEYSDSPDIYYSHGYATKQISGLGITLELGWKIDVGKAGGFFLRHGVSITYFFLKDELDLSNAPKDKHGKVVEPPSYFLHDAFPIGAKYLLGACWAF